MRNFIRSLNEAKKNYAIGIVGSSDDPSVLSEDYVGLTFQQFLTEAVDQKTALAKLEKMAWGNRSFADVSIWATDIFQLDPQEPPPSKWNDIVTHRKKVGGLKLQNVPVNKLIPTQQGMSVSGITHYIKQNPNRWNSDPDAVISVVQHQGKFYLLGGHHRAAAAILMGYPTVPAEVRQVPTIRTEEVHPEWVGKKGECFRNANKWNAQYGERTDFVVHGMVTNGAGHTFPHAWIERGETAIDPTTGVSFPKTKYYSMLHVTNVTRYSSIDAIRLQIKQGHHGPWN